MNEQSGEPAAAALADAGGGSLCIRRGSRALLAEAPAKTVGRPRRMRDVETRPGRVPAQQCPALGGGRDIDLAALLAQVAKGDRIAFEAVYGHVSAPVFGIVRSVVRDPSQSEEVTQEVLVEVWRAAARFDPGRGSPMSWVATIAHRRAVDRVRSEQRSALREYRAATTAVAYDEVAETALDNLDAERVRRCLGSLTELQREAVTLAYYGGYTYRQVAALLGVAAGTVNTRMRDGLIRLRDCLGVGR
jgi:RNA polymerase sigma-70 factor, ECF subfamily